MRESEPPARQARWLLIGNSRWHWAAPDRQAGPGAPLRVWHTPALEAGQPLSPPIARSLAGLGGWAAVGQEPDGVGLPPAMRLTGEAVPLADRPPWLGIDRALVGWAAWRRCGGAVLVADAGTVLSFTRVDPAGRFAGGRLVAGAALQLRAMGAATRWLPQLARLAPEREPDPAWPQATAAAMRAGVSRALAAAIAAAAREARQQEPGCTLVLTGGDAEDLAPLVRALLEERPEAGPPEREPAHGRGGLLLLPDLALEALAALRPGSP